MTVNTDYDAAAASRFVDRIVALKAQGRTSDQALSQASVEDPEGHREFVAMHNRRSALDQRFD
jgi:hypothetical protein